MIYSIELPEKHFKEGDGNVTVTILATDLYNACRNLYLGIMSIKYRDGFSKKVEKHIPKSQDFEELKTAYKEKLDFQIESYTIAKEGNPNNF